MVLFRIQALNVLINDRSQEYSSVHYDDWFIDVQVRCYTADDLSHHMNVRQFLTSNMTY